MAAVVRSFARMKSDTVAAYATAAPSCVREKVNCGRRNHAQITTAAIALRIPALAIEGQSTLLIKTPPRLQSSEVTMSSRTAERCDMGGPRA